MRGTVSKRLRRQAAKEFPRGSKQGRGKGMAMLWSGTRRRYRDLKKEYQQGV